MEETIRTIRLDDPGYPQLLRHISNPPKLLYYRGLLPTQAPRILAVVGTRRMSAIGRRSCQLIVPVLARAGYTIVSGLAYGLDTLAHEETLAHNGRAVAVLANGLDDDSIYPRENRPLIHRIIDAGGCIFSEFAPGIRPQRYFFPLRNRIVAGMSHGVLVIEAPEKSGTLSTAFRALNENREVLAVPGPITHSTFGGTNLLLKKGAHVVTSANDVFEVFGDDPLPSNEQSSVGDGCSDREYRILECIAEEALHLDEIIECTKLDIRAVHSTLGILELKGLIYSTGNGRYIKK